MIDPDAPPAEKLEAWLAEQRAAGAMDRPHGRASRVERYLVEPALIVAAGLFWTVLAWIVVRAIGQAAGLW